MKLDPHSLARGIVDRQLANEEFEKSVADRAFFKSETGPSLAEQFWAETRLKFSRADDSRVAGWAQIHTRLKGVDGVPMIYFFKTCVHTIRCLPLLQHCDKNPDDVAQRLEDHAPDCVRYICMSRPIIHDAITHQYQPRGYTSLDFDPDFELNAA